MAPKKRQRTASGEAGGSSAATDSLVLKASHSTADGLRQALTEMWRSDTLCDVEIQIEGRSFRAHRNVLAAESPYLKALFTTTMKERSGPIMLQEPSAATFASALEFMYSHECTLASQDELQPLLQAASLLRVPSLEGAVELVMAERLEPSSALRALALADHLSLPTLAAAAKKLALKNFEEAVAVEDGAALTALSAEKLGELLEADTLIVSDEWIVFESVKQWLAAQQPAAATAVAGGLLAHVRFPLVAKERQVKLESDELALQHPMLLAKAYREAFAGEDTPRTRRRRGKFVTYEDLKAGLKVRVKDDKEFVKAECVKPLPGDTNGAGRAGWNRNMKDALGKEFTVIRVSPMRNALLTTSELPELDEDYFFPPTCLEFVA